MAPTANLALINLFIGDIQGGLGPFLGTWLAQSASPRIPEKAARNALRTLCKAYGWDKRMLNLDKVRRMTRPDPSALVCVPQQVH